MVMLETSEAPTKEHLVGLGDLELADDLLEDGEVANQTTLGEMAKEPILKVAEGITESFEEGRVAQGISIVTNDRSVEIGDVNKALRGIKLAPIKDFKQKHSGNQGFKGTTNRKRIVMPMASPGKRLLANASHKKSADLTNQSVKEGNTTTMTRSLKKGTVDLPKPPANT